MAKEYQMSFDDIEKQIIVQSQPNRTAYIDECGSYGFDFTTKGSSKYYILCAVVVEDTKITELHHAINEIKKNNGFANTELKSSKIGSDNKRRTRIISQLLPIEFRIVLFIANKQEFINDTPLTEYKKFFIKFLHQRLYDMLYHVYPKLKIIEEKLEQQNFRSLSKNMLRKEDHSTTFSMNMILIIVIAKTMYLSS